jgi:hypothetical protein
MDPAQIAAGAAVTALMAGQQTGALHGWTALIGGGLVLIGFIGTAFLIGFIVWDMWQERRKP